MRIKLLVFIWFISLSASAQNKQLIYNFDDLPQNLLTNPGGETNFDMHIGLPLLSQIHLSAGSSGVSLYDIFQEGGSVNDRIRRSLFKMTRRDFFTVNQQLEIFSIGWRDQKRRYYTAGIYQELDAFLYFPKDPALLAYEGNKNYIGKNFNFSDAAFTADALNVFHIGFTNYYSEDLNYGFRGKIYSGVFNSYSVGNKGTFRTELSPEGPNIYRHYMNGVDVLINTAGYADLLDAENPSGIGTLSKIGKRAFLGGNLGLGLDAGFTWYPSDQYRVTGSILDIGFIRHSKNVENYRYYGNYQTDGIQLLFPGNNAPSYWDEWEDDLDRNLKDETLTNSYITWRPVKINASIDYGFYENAEPCNCYRPMGRRRYYNHIGAQVFAMKRPRGLNYATTLYYDRTFNENLRAKFTYTADSYSFSNIGLMVSAKLYNFNVYLAADNLLDYTNLAKARNASVQLGFQLLFSRE
ncbi:DUF5723 family protein [Salinimicrobium xinjiangense]|uniref:DUF5723 family protein n=1 Tax=Salinimicrobium xinjiangense TaxID=438596 RepID=UPI000424737E|nr:DUF5723 family protein [Salinimicrobium xinjiangense]